VKVILREDIDGVGKRGDICEVADGYARNLLLPRGMAIVATAKAADQAAAMRRARDQRDAADRTAAQEVATKLVSSRITIEARVGTEGKLFGSITTTDIAEAVEAQTGIVLDRRHVHLDEPIRSVGEHMATARLHNEVEFPITVDVVAK
jgi:large subunit ribosomal protein L9